MSFAFLGASWLWCLPAVAAPVVFHLAWRLKRKRLPVPSLVFFQRLSPRLQARKRLRDLLVLALRCLVILLVVLSLARPSWSGFLGSSSAVVAIVVDNSSSMGMPADAAGGSTRLAAALADAGALIGELAGGDRAVVVTTVADPLVPSLSEPTGDKARLRAILDAVRETHAPSAVGVALKRACDYLAASSSSRREIHVLSDLQAHEWDAPALGALTLPSATALFVHRIPSKPVLNNVSLNAIEVSNRGRLSGRPIPLRVMLTNLGSSSCTVTVAVSDDAGHHRTQATTIAAHEGVAVPLALPATTAGMHWAEVAIDGDDFALDNIGYVAFSCHDRRSVICCGDEATFGYLPLALSPAADGSLSGLSTRFCQADELATLLQTPPALVVMSWEGSAQLSPAQGQRLQEYLAAGGRLALCQGAGVTAGAPAAASALPSWLGIHGEVAALDKPEPLIALDQRDQAFHDLLESDGSIHLASVRVSHLLSLHADGDANWKPLLGLVDGRAIMARRAWGSGEIFCWGIGFTKSWSSLPMSPAFLAISQALALPMDADDGVLRLRAGEATRVAFGHGQALHVVSIAGDALDRTVDLASAGELPGFPRAGVYAISNPQGEHLLCSVRCDPDEGRPEVVSSATINALAPGPYQVDTCQAPADLVARYRHRSAGLDLMPALVILALLAVLAEGWIANQPLISSTAASTTAARVEAA